MNRDSPANAQCATAVNAQIYSHTFGTSLRSLRMSQDFQQILKLHSKQFIYPPLRIQQRKSALLVNNKNRPSEGMGSVRGRYGSVRDRYGVGTGSVRGRYWIGTGSVRGRYWIGTGLVRGRYWIGTGSVLDRYGIGTGSVRGWYWIGTGMGGDI